MHQGSIHVAAWKDVQDLEEKFHFFLAEDSLDIKRAFYDFG